MTCLSEATVTGFLERSLSIEERAELEVHVDGCASCRRLVIELSSGLQLLSAVAEAHTTHPARPAGDGEVLARGTVVDRFVVLDLLGRGGMGVVYMAYDPELDRKVALKLLHPSERNSSDPRAQLLAEAQVMARISHANVIAIYDVGTYREQVFAAMELVEGTTLRRWIAERRTWREVVDVFLLAGEGLAAAHAAGVVHRDFKPENVLLGGDGRVKVSDFGLAADPSPTTGHIAGTPGYLAVEGFRPGGVDARGDQFSFCVALHEALHGRRPFSAQELDDFVAEVRRGPPLDGGSRVSARLNHVVRRGLALAPEDRYPSMRELLTDIRRAVTAHRMRRRMTATVGALALAIGATAIVVDAWAVAQQLPCADAEARLAGIWDRGRRDAVKAAFVRTATPAATAAFDRVAAAIDRYAADWIAIRIEACAATEVRHEQSAALLELRMACLDQARFQLRELSNVLVAADADTVQKAESAVVLPALDRCSDRDALRAIVSPPLAMAARAQIQISSDASDEARLGDPSATQPDFRLPFACGEAWQLTDKTRGEAGPQADFTLPGDESSAGFAVFASAPGWVSQLVPENGEVDIGHGGGWFTTYQHMTDIGVSLHQYVGRGQVIGRIGNVNVTNSLGGPGLPHLHYEQLYRPAVTKAGNGDAHDFRSIELYLERETHHPSATGPLIRTSTNNCPAGGVPGSAAQYDVPLSTRVFSRSQHGMEIMARRSSDRALFERWYDRGWYGAPLPYTIAGRPAVVVFNGELHVIARKSDGMVFDLQYSPFTGWKTTYLEGRVWGDLDAAVYGWGKRLHVAARGADGLLYQWWTSANGSWSHPVHVNDIRIVGTPAMFSHYDALYIAARAADNSLRIWRTDRRGLSTEWRLPDTVSGDPNIAVDPRSGLVNIVARGIDNRLRRWQSKDPDKAANHLSEGWSDPELVDADRTVTGAPATTVYHGVMHIFARAPTNAIYHWWNDGAWHCDEIGGTYTGDPDVVHFGAQLQTIGRGADGDLYTVWFDPASGFWNVEDQGVPVTD